MLDMEYAEYRCGACKKEIKNVVIKCKVCVKAFFHPGCIGKHKIFRDKELVKCEGPYEELTSIEKAETKKSPSTSRIGTSQQSDTDRKIDWLIRLVKEMKDEVNDGVIIKTIIKNIIQEELQPMRREIEEIKRSIQMIGKQNSGQISYSEATKRTVEENILIIKPKAEQKSEVTKQVVKKNVNTSGICQ